MYLLPISYAFCLAVGCWLLLGLRGSMHENSSVFCCKMFWFLHPDILHPDILRFFVFLNENVTFWQSYKQHYVNVSEVHLRLRLVVCPLSDCSLFPFLVLVSSVLCSCCFLPVFLFCPSAPGCLPRPLPHSPPKMLSAPKNVKRYALILTIW